MRGDHAADRRRLRRAADGGRDRPARRDRAARAVAEAVDDGDRRRARLSRHARERRRDPRDRGRRAGRRRHRVPRRHRAPSTAGWSPTAGACSPSPRSPTRSPRPAPAPIARSTRSTSPTASTAATSAGASWSGPTHERAVELFLAGLCAGAGVGRSPADRLAHGARRWTLLGAGAVAMLRPPCCGTAARRRRPARAEVERIARATLDYYEMPQVEARLQRGPLTRRMHAGGPGRRFPAPRDWCGSWTRSRASSRRAGPGRPARRCAAAARRGRGCRRCSAICSACCSPISPSLHRRTNADGDGDRSNWVNEILAGHPGRPADRRRSSASCCFRPRQRVRLTDEQRRCARTWPRRREPAERRQGIADEAAAATGDVAGQILGAHGPRHLPGASGPPDDLQRLKGVGPKLAAMLNERGITRFEQLARLTRGPVERARRPARRVPRPPHAATGSSSRPIISPAATSTASSSASASFRLARRRRALASSPRRRAALTSNLSILRPSMSTISN